MSKSNRLLEFDVLRGIAALLVVMYHYTTHYDEIYRHSQEVLVYFPFGHYGVELFFMISGFVIFMTLERSKRSLDFVVGRFARLYPAYWTAVIVTFTITTIAGLPVYQVGWRDALVNLTMLEGFLDVPFVDGAYWTLGRELVFYTIMFVLYRARLLKHIDTITIGWLLLIVVSIVLEKQAVLVLDQKIQTLLLLQHACQFIAGMMFYKIYKEGFSLKRYTIITACALVYALDHTLLETSLFILFILIFDLILRGRLAFINCTPLIFMGTISYSLYLVHQNIGYVIIRTLYKFGINPNTSIFIALVLSLLLASTITFLIEQPAIGLIKRHYKTRVLRQT